MEAREQFRHFLGNRGLRVTTERLAIFDEVMASPGHFDVETLLARLRKGKRRVSRATLYRTLGHLVDSGLVQKIETGEGLSRYEKMYGREHHDHMICVGCGSSIEFECEEIERLQDWVCRRNRFTLLGHTLQIKGLCRKCAVSRSAGKAGTA